MERRLSAILAADMVGYSRLMEADEIGTIERHKAHRRDVIDPAFAEHNGRIVKTTGDGLLAEFPSVVEAVQCAVAIQRVMEGHEADVSENRRIRYRIGINLGDIIIDDALDVFGDGVNIAARLEQISEPGGICISGTTFDHLKAQVEVGYEALGEVRVKNIQRPIRAYKVLTASEQVGRLIEGESKPAAGSARSLVKIALVVLLTAIGGGVWWWLQPVTTEPADPSRAAYSLPDKPSIAILPFENLSGDPDQDYFADGFTEDIITNIAQSRELFVIDRNSTFTYKGQAASIKRVAEELGVRFVLEGSARRVGENMRITAQLIDTSSGAHVWAKRYDRPVESVFDVQTS